MAVNEFDGVESYRLKRQIRQIRDVFIPGLEAEEWIPSGDGGGAYTRQVAEELQGLWDRWCVLRCELAKRMFGVEAGHD